MQWPERPTCHNDSWSPFAISEVMAWRESDPGHARKCDCGYERLGPYGYPFRTCGYDGSIHPEDLAYWLEHGATLHGSDWKYGFPHKLYVENIPNPLSGKNVDSSSSGQWFDHEPTPDELVSPLSGISITKVFKTKDNWWNVHHHSRTPAPVHSVAKFYTAHLEDKGYDEEALNLILKLVSQSSGIEFFRNPDASIAYRAPYFGFQRA